MFRIVASNDNKDHPDSAPFAVGNLYPDLDSAKAAVSEVKKDYPARDGYSVAVEELVRKSDDKSVWEERS